MRITADMLDGWREAIDNAERTGDLDYIAGISDEMHRIWIDMQREAAQEET